MMIKKIKPKPLPRVPFKKAIGFSFFSFPSNSLGYRIFHFSFFSFPLNSLGYRIFHFSLFVFLFSLKQAPAFFYLFTFKSSFLLFYL